MGVLAHATVGVQCARGCSLAGQRVDITDGDGAIAGSATLGESPAPGTEGLYCAVVSFNPPASPGVATRVAVFAPENTDDVAHCGARAVFTFRTDPPGEHVVIVRIVRRGTSEPLQGVDVRLGVYARCTDEQGEARFLVPAGTYDCSGRKSGFDFDATTLEVAGRLEVCVEAAVGLTREEFDQRLSRYEDHPWG
jgi:hypothetical protein